MNLKTITALGISITAVHCAPATLVARDCVYYVGNSWGCDPPAGVAPNWNYCQAANPDYPVCVNHHSFRRV